jgi:hypothetical protein
MKVMQRRRKILLIPVVTLLLFSGCNTEKHQEEVIKNNFNNNVELICGDSRDTYSNATLVIKSSGWSLYKEHYFKRGEKLIHLLNCFKEEQKIVYVF